MSYALITGASKGIGKAMAEVLAAKGKNLLLVARSANLLGEVAEDLKKRFNVDIRVLALDLSAVDAAGEIRKWCLDQKFKINILINNAGYGLWGKFEQLTLAEQQNMMQLNVTTLVELTYHLLPILKEEKQSYILNVASTTAYQAVPCMSLYAASKAFVLSFTRGLRFELRKSNISVTCLSPGSTTTNFIERAKMQALEKTAEKVSMKPEDVAKIGLAGMFAKKAEIIPGMVNKISAGAASYLPKSLLEKIAAGIYEKFLHA